MSELKRYTSSALGAWTAAKFDVLIDEVAGRSQYAQPASKLRSVTMRLVRQRAMRMRSSGNPKP